MLISIQKTRKLFRVEDIGNGKVDVEASNYLLSLPEGKQIEVLKDHLGRLERDRARYDTLSPDKMKPEDGIIRAQLQLLIQVIEGLLAQILTP